ncbi:uncharacterized protein LOC141657306 [Silene latifolia]|uniref:uncharacterized protein LOC141657306 n=1 Tax=Silene latifolia TaxID=37657 RepID=UPI003D77573C
MGCSASRLDTLIAKAIEDPSSSTTSSSSQSSSNNSSLCVSSSSSSSIVPKTRSFSTPLVHHPAIEKGDTHHLVCLTSSTYGSLNVTGVENGDFSGKSSPDSVINTWELMEGLEDEENVINYRNNNDFKNTHKLPTSKFVDFGSDFKVKLPASKLGLNLIDSSRDFNDAKKVPSEKFGVNLSDSMMKLSDSYVFVEVPDEIVEEKEVGFGANPNSKPLWKHLSEESLLSKMDPNVCNAYDRALLAKKLGCSQSGKVIKSVGSSPNLFVSKSKSMGTNAPVVSKLGSEDDGMIRECENKIVLYFTSLRGIRKTFEDCSSVRMILRGFRVVVDEKDISMDSSYRKELQSALGGKAMSLPQLFVRGKHIGGVDDVKLLHETGELEKILEGCPTKDCGSVCHSCGDARFVPCSYCNGSRKVFQEEEGRTKRCPDCNENGLVRCPGCCS